MKRSTGLRNHMLATGSFRSAVAGSVIHVFGGVVPASADDAVGASTLLCTVSVDGDGTGVTLEANAVGGAISKNPDEVWVGEVLTSGTATFFRMASPADAGDASTTAVRLQGTVGLVGADLNLSSISMVLGDARRIKFFSASIPAG